MSLDVNKKSVSSVLEYLKNGEWQIPQFQREFVWNSEQVRKLINSFLNFYPIGLITVWDQPQNNPYTPGEKLKLKGDVEFGNYAEEEKPAVIKLVLDGKQRLTTLAMVFAGFSTNDDRYNFSGSWFLNLEAYIANDEQKIVMYKNKKEIREMQLDNIASCVQKSLIPFKDFEKLGQYIAQIHNSSIYVEGKFPAEDIRNRRMEALIKLQDIFSKFLVPIAEIPNSITLGDVCEIFDVLNTTGTKVSTFDLIHNLLFKDSEGRFNLRDRFNDYKDLASFSFLCDDNRQEFLCQLVTGCYVLREEPKGRDSKKIESIKGPDLINTPLSFYGEIDTNINSLDVFANELFSDVFGAELSIKDIPYPASIIIYFALRWVKQFGGAKYSISAINKVFKAFFWRNVLNKRYDQGFLTQYSKDLKSLYQILENGTELPENSNDWVHMVNSKLDELFGEDAPIQQRLKIENAVLSSDVKGALRAALLIPLKANTKLDFISNTPLNWNSADRNEKVQIHHIFPKKWCSDNKNMHGAIVESGGPNLIANLCPIKAKSNNEWKSKGPSTAINYLNVDYIQNKKALDSAFIDEDSFNSLKKDALKDFWESRAKAISKYIYDLQIVT